MKTKVQLKNLYLIAVIAIGLIGLGVGSTFAMFNASTSIDNPIAFNSNLSSINLLAETIEVTVPAGEDKNVDIVVSNTSIDSLNYTAWYSPTSNDLVVGSTSSNNSYGPVGTLSTSANFTLTVQLRNKGDTPITVTIGVSSSDSQVVISEGTTVIPSTQLLPYAAKYITNLYNAAEKSNATVDSITYNLAPSVNLMNDRYGSMDTDIDGGNIRYYGANPNNYVWLGDTYTSTYTFSSNGTSITRNVGDKKLWRIIGVFDGRLKLISNDEISSTGLSWDTSANTTGGNSGYGINQWGPSGSYEGADLMRLLNPGYEDESVNNSLYWNKALSGTVYTGSGNATTINFSFANVGLTSVEQNLIDDAVWYTGEYNGAASYAHTMYLYEKGNVGKKCSSEAYCNDVVERVNFWHGKVGLMHLSDYGFATDLMLCNQTLNNYSALACVSNDWIYDSSKSQWTISARAHPVYASLVFDVSDNGNAGHVTSNRNLSVRPAIYLKSDVTIDSSGKDGSSSKPYELKR